MLNLIWGNLEINRDNGHMEIIYNMYINILTVEKWAS